MSASRTEEEFTENNGPLKRLPSDSEPLNSAPPKKPYLGGNSLGFSSENVNLFIKWALSYEEGRTKKLKELKQFLQDRGWKEDSPPASAVKHFLAKAEAEKGNGNAQYWLAIFYSMGWGVETNARSDNIKKSIGFLTIAKDKGHEGARKLYDIYCESPLYAENLSDQVYQSRLELYEMEAGNLPPDKLYKLYNLGIYLALGWGIPRNYQRAIDTLNHPSLIEYDKEEGDCILNLLNLKVGGEGITRAVEYFKERKKENLDIFNNLIEVWEVVGEYREIEEELKRTEELKKQFVIESQKQMEGNPNSINNPSKPLQLSSGSSAPTTYQTGETKQSPKPLVKDNISNVTPPPPSNSINNPSKPLQPSSGNSALMIYQNGGKKQLSKALPKDSPSSDEEGGGAPPNDDADNISSPPKIKANKWYKPPLQMNHSQKKK